MPDDPTLDQNIDPQQGDPAPETPPEPGQGDQQQPEQETQDWKSQYDELRSDYTRKTQRLSEHERLIGQLQSRDPQAQAEALNALGLLDETALYEGDEFQDDPQAQLEARLAALEAERATEAQQREAEAQFQQEVEYLEGALAGLEKQIGRQLSEDEVRLYGYVASNVRTEDGLPDVAGAHRLIEDQMKARLEEYRQSKRVPQVQPGTAGNKDIDFSDPDARARYMADRVRAERAAQG